MSSPKSLVLYGATNKVETTAGTYTAPAIATDGLQVAELPVFDESYGFDGERPVIPGSAGQQIRVAPQGRTVKGLPIKIEDRGLGVAYSAAAFPKDSHFLRRAAGFDAVFSGGGGAEKITYTPTPFTAAPTTLSMDLYDEVTTAATWVKYPLNMIYADWEYEASDGKPAIWTFQISGRVNAEPTEVAYGSGITYAATPVPPVASPLVMVVNGVSSLVIRKVNVKGNRMIQERYPDQNAAGAHAGFQPGERKPVLIFTMEASLFATFNPRTLRTAGTAFAVSFQVGGTQYNRTKWTLPQCQVIEAKKSADGPVPLWDVTCSIHNSTPGSNDDISIAND